LKKYLKILKMMRKSDKPLRLIFIKELEKVKSHRVGLYKCSCGNETITRISNVEKGITKSCGCIHKEALTEKVHKNNITHNLTNNEYFKIWRGIINRCTNPKAANYKYYGAKGITICEEWINSPENFIKDVGERPNKTYSLDRIDNTKGYFKENCKWSTHKEQMNNRNNNILITFNNETKSINDWATQLNINMRTIVTRLRRGWSVEKTLTKII